MVKMLVPATLTPAERVLLAASWGHPLSAKEPRVSGESHRDGEVI